VKLGVGINFNSGLFEELNNDCFRALIHHPVYAETNQRFSSLQEESAIEILIGIANGMNHLVQKGVSQLK
jgi:hypothetical protein